MPEIFVDDEVYEAMSKDVVGFMTPNDVLRKKYGLNPQGALAREPNATGPSGEGGQPQTRAWQRLRTRAGRYEYELEGRWLSARSYLMALEERGHAVARQRRQAFNTVLRGNGNGLSNLAKDIAQKLGHPRREI